MPIKYLVIRLVLSLLTASALQQSLKNGPMDRPSGDCLWAKPIAHKNSQTTHHDLRPGESFELNANPHKIEIGLAWDPSDDERYIDIDLNLHVVKRSKRIASSIWYNKRMLRTSPWFGWLRCIEHLSDSINGNGDGENETIYLNLRRISFFRPRISHLVASISLYSRHHIQEVSDAICHIRIQDKHGGQSVIRFRISDSLIDSANKNAKTSRGVVLFSLHKNSDGIWTVKVLGELISGIDHSKQMIAEDCLPSIIELLRAGDLDI